MRRTTKNCRHQDSRQFSYALTVDLLPFGFGVVKLFVQTQQGSKFTVASANTRAGYGGYTE